jgi:hypothetical protein
VQGCYRFWVGVASEFGGSESIIPQSRECLIEGTAWIDSKGTGLNGCQVFHAVDQLNPEYLDKEVAMTVAIAIRITRSVLKKKKGA